MSKIKIVWNGNMQPEYRTLEAADEFLLQGFRDYLVRRLPINFPDEFKWIKEASFIFIEEDE